MVQITRPAQVAESNYVLMVADPEEVSRKLGELWPIKMNKQDVQLGEHPANIAWRAREC